jgi:hypothetical protein
MHQVALQFVGRSLTVVAAAALFAACADEAPVAPVRPTAIRANAAVAAADLGKTNAAATSYGDVIATLRRATARYQDLRVARDEGFVFLHGCEVRTDEGPVGTVYVHPGRLFDGVIDPALPDALIYAPGPERPRLVAAELAMPYTLWTPSTPPQFLGNTFQREDEFGVFGLHVWIWRENPEGMFAEANPRVSCGTE